MMEGLPEESLDTLNAPQILESPRIFFAYLSRAVRPRIQSPYYIRLSSKEPK
jgi:hypothetical protein